MNNVALRLLGSAASTVDRAFVAALQMRNRRVRARAESLSHEDRIASLARIQQTYGDPALISDRAAFFPPPSPALPVVRHVRALRELGARGECLELSWASAFEPFDPRAGEVYLSHVPNRTACARIYGAGGRRPAVIVVHGYMGGHWMLEEAQWPIAWLTKRGLDVALPLLPFHALRGGSRRGPPPFRFRNGHAVLQRTPSTPAPSDGFLLS